VKHKSAQKKSQFFDGPPLGKLAPLGGGDPRSGGAWGPHAPRKRFGQHFLTDGGIIHAIVDAIAPKPGQAMVEIGPGLGALTQPLVERLGTLTVIELDRDLAVRLRLRPALDVIESDVLKVDFSHVRQAQTAINNIANDVPKTTTLNATNPLKLRVVGNLPYNISTPILFHLLDFVDDIEDQHFMLQKEVIDRMVARPATAAYGRLSVMLQWRYAMQNVLFVPPESFEPPPRVDSAVVRMVPRSDFAAVDVNRLSEVVRVSFSQRRKLLRHSLGKWLEEKAFSGSFNLQRRAEEVPVAEYIALAQQM
jgi:16S rRNA (adenine1518-N6/adenine1519-N6)-dimethyltransferase